MIGNLVDIDLDRSGPAPCLQSNAAEDLLWATRKAVLRFARVKSEVVARRVRFHARRLKASGIFSGNPRHLWDEYCWYLQEGPPQLDWAWNRTMDPLIDSCTTGLPASDQVLISHAQKWEDEDFYDVDPDGTSIDVEAMRRSVAYALKDLAEENPTDWLTQ